MSYSLHGCHTTSKPCLSSSFAPAKLAFTLCAAVSTVWAAPSAPLSRRQQLPNSDSQPASNGGGGKGIGPQVYAPIIIVVFLLVVLAVLSWNRGTWRLKLGNWGTAAAIASGTVVPSANLNSTRELTAELLAGGNNNSPATTPATTTTTSRPRRSRRNNRRTGSMISTRSLPMYMKEPGDEELVIYRGPSDMEDMPENMMNMPPVEEHGTESPDSSLNMSRVNTREYGNMPDSPHDMPLLSPEDFNPEADLSGQTLIPPPNLDQLHNRPSFETLLSTEDSDEHEHHDQQPDTPDPRGEAPPYFEVVPMDELNATTSRDTDVIPEDPETPETAQSVQSHHSQQASNGSRRRSIFGFLHRGTGAASPPPVPNNRNTTSHTRTDSGPSIVSVASTSNDGHSRNRSRTQHRPSQSTGNGSVFSLGPSPFRTISRQRSNAALDARLNSASMISLNSISAPLTHTLVRTEFTYPKSGPTPEQLKLISSRETFARFGVPYGPDAVAFASQSRVDLVPPPGFDEVTSSTPGPSGLSNANEDESGPDDEDSSNDVQIGADGVARRPSLRITVDGDEPADVQAGNYNPQVPSSSDVHATIAGGDDQRSAEHIPLPPSPAKSEENLPPPATTTSPVIIAPHPPPGLASTPAGPSSFKDPSPNPRSESRASSYLSFATAEEDSLHSTSPLPHVQVFDTNMTSEANGAAESPATTAPPTPRMPSARALQHDDADDIATPTAPSPSTIPVH